MKRSWILISGVLAVLLVVSVFTSGFKGGITGAVSAETAGEKTLSFINENLLSPGVEATLKGIEETNGVYVLKLDIQGKEIESYASRDGKLLFPSGMDLDVEVPAASETATATAAPEVTKSEKPEVEVFIMTYCPYGLQMQKAVLPVWELLEGEADFSIKWVDYIMHGEKEIVENNVQECIQREQGDKYLDYANCFVLSDDSETCLGSAGVDVAKLEGCIEDLDTEFEISKLYADQSSWSGGRYPQYNVHTSLNDAYSVQGSPTVVINGAQVSVARSPEAVKEAICNAFLEAPAECDEVLSSTAASPGIGGGTGTDSAASCN
jgi:hypothetical protein